MAQGGVPPEITISHITTPSAGGFVTYFFDVIPAAGTLVTSVEGSFRTELAGSMRQINPFSFATVLADNNGAIISAGEDPLGDSQFEFLSADVVFSIDLRESDTELNAALAGVGPFESRFTLAHVVLPEAISGSWEIAVVQREGNNLGSQYRRSGVFGPLDGSIVGDYNANGTVDAADYVVWRSMLGQAGSGLNADGNADGFVDAADYQLWQANFGRGGGNAAAVAIGVVPEPAGCVMWVMAAMGIAGWRRRCT